ncbi:MAG: site-specific integrase [Planctomycetota bacterium]|nr:site-specific integrase [Planctomycetota bacterium]
MEACGRSKSHRSNTRRYLERTFEACGFSRLGDLASGPMERWLLQEVEKGRSARSRNAFRIALVSFANWAVRNSRLLSNPFEKLPVANEAADRRRKRRPLTADELARLLYVAERRPLAEYGRETAPLSLDRCKGRRTWTKAPLTMETLDAAIRRARNAMAARPDFIATLEARGRRNAMFYRLAAFTGLRKSELASILLRDVHLDTTPPYLELHAENEKAGREAKLPLKVELVDMVRDYIAKQHQTADCGERSFLPDTPLIEPPTLKTFNLDLAVAGIEKVDSYGRSVDIHSLRHTFGTMLARSGVAPRTAQELMRHSDIRLTTNIYQHLELVDTAGAVEMLPDLEECRSTVAIPTGA